jgi:monoamine oxidase
VADYLAYDDAASERNWRLPGGYGALVESAADGIPRALGTRVESVAHHGGGVPLATDKGDIDAAAAIVTVSTEMLAAGTISLSTAFDAARDAPRSCRWAWPTSSSSARPSPTTCPKTAICSARPIRGATGSYYLRPFGRPVIEVFLGGAAARALENAGDGAAEAFAREELAALLGSNFARRITYITGSAWAKCETVRGSYSHALPGFADARAILAQPVDDRILLAGEACSPLDFTTAHGAYETGVAAADRFLASPPWKGGD